MPSFGGWWLGAKIPEMAIIPPFLLIKGGGIKTPVMAASPRSTVIDTDDGILL